METKKLEISTLKAVPGIARISGIDATTLTKALALKPMALVAKEDDKPVFIIALTSGQSVITPQSLEVNPEHIEEGLLGVDVTGNPETTLIAAAPYIKSLYEKAEELAKGYDEAKKLIKEV